MINKEDIKTVKKKKKEKAIPKSTGLIGRTIITNEHIIKITSMNKEKIYGYNILTECFVSISINEKYIENPEILFLLVKEERARFNYINSVRFDLRDIDKAKLMSLTDRTFYRIKSQNYKKRAPLINNK